MGVGIVHAHLLILFHCASIRRVRSAAFRTASSRDSSATVDGTRVGLQFSHRASPPTRTRWPAPASSLAPQPRLSQRLPQEALPVSAKASAHNSGRDQLSVSRFLALPVVALPPLTDELHVRGDPPRL